MDHCLADCCFACCYRACTCICTCRTLLVAVLIAAALSAVLVPAFGVVLPVRGTVDAASLSRLALVGANGTALAYDLALTVALHNDNWAMRAEHAAPLEAELRFAGRRLDGGRLDEVGRGWIDPRRTEVLRVVAVSERGVAISGDDAAEFARQSVAGVLELELMLSGAFMYRPVHVGGSRRLEATCPVRLQMEAAPSGTYFMLFDKVIQC
ncbi:unnamed protein product [Urochloa humidicola]